MVGGIEMIVDSKMLNYSDPVDFFNNLNKEIGNLQLKGYKVEVQYSKGDGIYSALIVARENK